MATGYEPSRQELLAWVNDLLQLDYVKIEQMGTGSAHCQILDSIYGDVPMSKVKWTSNQEIYFIDNFKILQSCFKKHKIEKPIPIDRLVKCKVLDNLEFFQWMKRFWDQYYQSGLAYDAVARRSGAPGGPVSNIGVASSRPAPRVTSATGTGLRVTSSATLNGRPAAAQSRVASGTQRPSPLSARNGNVVSATGGGGSQGTAVELKRLKQDLNEKDRQLAAQLADIEGAERESRFYFDKLRAVEQIIQEKLHVTSEDGKIIDNAELSAPEREVLERIQAKLYETEEGFENPPPEGDLMPEEVMADETF